ncbi:MAG: Mbeg1-like protein [Treponemataceae bacterium]
MNVIEETRNRSYGLKEYLFWRGDLSFSDSPYNEIDALIFSQLSYIHLGSVVSSCINEKKTLEQITKDFFADPDFKVKSDNGPLINKETVNLLEIAAKTKRFGNILLSNFVEDIDNEKEKQFSALTAFLDDGTVAVIFRGTHQEIVGYIEDINMAYMETIPSQAQAVGYLEQVAKTTFCKLRLAGHSKGGNMAVYAASFSSAGTKRKIICVHNFDGPGFKKQVISLTNFKKIENRTKNYITNYSIIGTLFYSCGQRFIVESDVQNLLYSHDPFNWLVLGNKFVTVKILSKESAKFEKTMKLWLETMSKTQTEMLAKSIVEILSGSDAENLKELQKTFPKSIVKMLISQKNMTKEEKQNFFETFRILRDSVFDSGINS